jgi:hypothetical protein
MIIKLLLLLLFKIVSGVRQGGILSPILFNAYVDDMIVNLRCNEGWLSCW